MDNPNTPEEACLPFASRSPLPSPTNKSEDIPTVSIPPVFKNFHLEFVTSPSTNFRSSADDPFIGNTASDSKKTRKLSATADPFLPGQTQSQSNPSAATDLSKAPETSATGNSSTPSSTMSEATLREPVTPGGSSDWTGIFEQVYPAGEFTGDMFSRYPQFIGVPTYLGIAAIRDMIKGKTFSPPKRIVNSTALRRKGIIVLEFSNIVDAVNAGAEIQFLNDSWKLDRYLNAHEYSAMLPNMRPLWSHHKGHLAIIGTWRGEAHFTFSHIIEHVLAAVKQHGSVLAWDVLKTNLREAFIHMEYYDIRDAEKAKAVLNGFNNEGFEMIVKDYHPGFETRPMPVDLITPVTDRINDQLTNMYRSYALGVPSSPTHPDDRRSSSSGTVVAGSSSVTGRPSSQESSSYGNVVATSSSVVAGPSDRARGSYANVAAGRRRPETHASLVSRNTSSVLSEDVLMNRPSGNALSGNAFSSNASSGNAFPGTSSNAQAFMTPSVHPATVIGDLLTFSSSGNESLDTPASMPVPRTPYNTPVVVVGGLPMTAFSANTLHGAYSNAQTSFSAGSMPFIGPSDGQVPQGMNNQGSSVYGQAAAGYGQGASYPTFAQAPTIENQPVRPWPSYPVRVNQGSQPQREPFPIVNNGHRPDGPTGFGPDFVVPFLESVTRHPSGRVTPPPGRDAFNNHNISANNIISMYRIHQGMEVRTTVMIRNIPNKMYQPELKAIIDLSSFGEYDFCYLRIDFANNCNVGYAFINFVDPEAVIKFVMARHKQRWPGYTSSRTAEVCWATVQGRENLVSRFRNSSIMLEDPSFRPKLYYTGNGPMAGREEIFPASNNAARLRRSIENAGAVGLFPPRAGQQFRDDQRRRRGQFDRGTHAAQIEEEGYASGSRGQEDESGAGMPYIPHPLPSNMPL